MPHRDKVALVLGSGSARGWAHIGVIRALMEEGIRPDMVCGASIGALVGAVYAEGNLDEFESWVRSLSWKGVMSLLDPGWRGGLVAGLKLFENLSERFIQREFSDLELPFAAVATDLWTGREVWLREGRIADAVRASIAMPTAVARPVPSGPVVTSTPAVWPYSGWPGARLPHVRKDLRSSNDSPYPDRYNWIYSVRLLWQIGRAHV